MGWGVGGEGLVFVEERKEMLVLLILHFDYKAEAKDVLQEKGAGQ